MEKLIHIIQDLSHVRSLREIVDIVRRAARQATGADGATFVLRDNEYCFYVDEDAIGPLWKGKRFPLSACISGWAMLNKQSVVISDIYQDKRIPIEAYQPTFVKSLVMVPIRQNDPIGAIGNYWARPHTASMEEIALLQAIADTTSVAMENVQLFNSLEERVRELENAHRIKDEFLMLISHELRTPLNSIMGWSEALLQEVKKENELCQQGLQAIHRNSQLQCRVVDSLIDASNIVLGKFSVQKSRIDFLPLIKQAVIKAQALAQAHEIQIDLHTMLQAAWLNADEQRVRQVADALIQNAIQFSTRGGKILIELIKEGPSVTLKVRDFGMGIKPEQQLHLFNRFSQTERYMTRTHGGLGLQLMIAKSIVEAHQGEIHVFSSGEIGKGTEFKVSLPLLAEKNDVLVPLINQGLTGPGVIPP